jgi:predicted RNase H-like HicB family nuclease
MNELVINTSKTEAGYSASCDLLPGWIVAFTGSFDGFTEYIKESLDFYVECAREDKTPYPEILDDANCVIRYRFDIQSLLLHYQRIFSYSALQHITGVNQRQLWHYAAGMSKPRPKQAQKIVSALNSLGKELSALSV